MTEFALTLHWELHFLRLTRGHRIPQLVASRLSGLFTITGLEKKSRQDPVNKRPLFKILVDKDLTSRFGAMYRLLRACDDGSGTGNIADTEAASNKLKDRL
jgi:hypothetical protein